MFRRASVIAVLCAACVTKEDRKSPQPDAAARDVAVASADAAPRPTPTILVLGDSHTYGELGRRLHERLAGLGAYAVVSQAAGGATTETYLEARPEASVGYRMRESARGESLPRETAHRLRGPILPLDTLLAKHDPEIVVVALGTNRTRAPVGENTEVFLQHVVRDRARKIIWIGPPAVGADGSEARVTSLEAAVGKFPNATFIDSRPFNASKPLPADNPHFGPDDARRWADFTFARMELSPDDAASPSR